MRPNFGPSIVHSFLEQFANSPFLPYFPDWPEITPIIGTSPIIEIIFVNVRDLVPVRVLTRGDVSAVIADHLTICRRCLH